MEQMEQTVITEVNPPKKDSITLPETLGRSVSLEQAARLLRVSRRTIYNHIRDGHLVTIRTYGSQRVLVESLQSYTSQFS
jgi:excisionase family DNA binding protein